MDPRMLPHNSHLEAPEAFASLDPHLRQLEKLPLVHRSELIARIPRREPGIYTVSGGRQVGKTTLLKQWVAQLIENKFDPTNIVYLTGELIDDHHSLVRLITEALNEMSTRNIRYLIVDEVTYIRGWDKGIKYLADAGLLENVALILTDSDIAVIRESRMRFPGRRGQAETVDFHLYPLSFYEYIKLKDVLTREELNLLEHTQKIPLVETPARLLKEFENYLIHGGFLTAIKDMARYQRISLSTLATYSDWIRGDVLKRNKREGYLREILAAIIKRYGSQITWNNLVQDLSIDHPKTVSDYMELLVSMEAAYVQPAIREEKVTAAPKKAKKVMFKTLLFFMLSTHG